MSIITKAGTPVKGSPTQFTLDKSALAAVTMVAADSYFSQSSNWKEVSLSYKSSAGSQHEIVKFDAALASPTANFAVSLKARDVFQIQKIIIKDFDGGSFEVPRSALTTAEFDVDMSAPALTAILYNLLYNSTTSGSIGEVSGPSSPGVESSWAKATNTTYINQDFSFTFNLPSSVYPDAFVGIGSTTADSTAHPYALGALFVGSTYFSVYYAGSNFVNNISLDPISNVIKIERTGGGSQIMIYHNNVLLYTANGWPRSSSPVFPSVRPKQGTCVTSSYAG